MSQSPRLQGEALVNFERMCSTGGDPRCRRRGVRTANLGLAIAIAEHNARGVGDPLTARFVERQPRSGWYRGMLIEDATMQVSYLKDLVTLRCPTSLFSFLSYLHDRGQLVGFIDYGSSFPTRVEFHDYLEWAASTFAAQVDYGTEVIGMEPMDGDATVECVEVVIFRADVETTRLRARNVVLATGLRPHLPEGVSAGDRIWHSCEPKAATLTAPERLTVVGAGRSAAEVVDYLHRTFPSAEVCAVFARYGYSPADDTSFANRVFDPSAVDAFFRALDEAKDLILGYHANTNYSMVDPELIESLYRRHYQEKVTGHGGAVLAVADVCRRSGWLEDWHGKASRKSCLGFIEENWTDMRPKSLIKQMEDDERDGHKQRWTHGVGGQADWLLGCQRLYLGGYLNVSCSER